MCRLFQNNWGGFFRGYTIELKTIKMKARNPTVLLLVSLCVSYPSSAFCWNNGPSGDAATDEDHPNCDVVPYATHDWIADHARALLPQQERQWVDQNIKLYFLGTEAPDNDDIPDTCNAPGNGYDDRNQGHSIEWNSDHSEMVTDRAAFRAKGEYLKAVQAIKAGQLANAAYYLGAMAHYVGDVSQYGHSVSFEDHHSDYEGLVRSRTRSFDAGDFETYIVLGELSEIDPYDAKKNCRFLRPKEVEISSQQPGWTTTTPNGIRNTGTVSVHL